MFGINHRVSLVAIAIFSLQILTCASAQSPNLAPKPNADLVAQISALRKTLGELEKRLNSQAASLTKLELSNLQYASAEFDPSEASFQRIDSTVGTFAVSVQDVETFADGIRITIHMGNLTSARFTGAKLELQYGPRRSGSFENAAEMKKYSDWFKSLQSKTENVVQELLPGNWNAVRIVLPNIKQEEFGYLSISVDTPQISLSGG
jgi:hypothetical protein